MSDSDKQALLDGTATIQTEIEIIEDNVIDPVDVTKTRSNWT